MSNFKEKIESEIAQLNLEPIEYLSLFKELIFPEEKELYNSKIIYTKKYFAEYYSIDVKTFNNWIALFCPEIYDQYYKLKSKKFTENEFNTIIDELGVCDELQMIPYTRTSLFKFLYLENNWKKSRSYEEFKSEIKRIIPKELHHISVFPPEIARKILIHLIEFDLVDKDWNSQKDYFVKLKEFNITKIINSIKNKNLKERMQDRELFRKKLKDAFFPISKEK